MGGPGSGWFRRRKLRVGECLSLDINALVGRKRARGRGQISWIGRQTTLLARYKIDLTSRCLRLTGQVEATIALTSTVLHSGGLRWWFVCPRCGRRAAKLYLPPNERMFGCRVCYDLAYPPSRGCRERRS